MEKVAQSGSARPTQSGPRSRPDWVGRGPDWVTRRFALGGRRPPRSTNFVWVAHRSLIFLPALPGRLPIPAWQHRSLLSIATNAASEGLATPDASPPLPVNHAPAVCRARNWVAAAPPRSVTPVLVPIPPAARRTVHRPRDRPGLHCSLLFYRLVLVKAARLGATQVQRPDAVSFPDRAR